MSLSHFALLPRDGVFCKDGRGWYTSDVGRSHAHAWPPPSTVRGALRAAWGQQLLSHQRALDWERDTERLGLVRLLTLRRPLGAPFTLEHRLWPAPADALLLSGSGEPGAVEVVRLTPRRPEVATLGPGEDAALECLWQPRVSERGKPLRGSAFWRESDMVAWLQRGSLEAPPGRVEPARRVDFHVSLEPRTQTARRSMLYSSEVIEMVERGGHEWALGVECTLPAADTAFPRGPIGLGGKRRLALAERLTPELFAPPEGLGGEWPGLRLVLATPACFQRGWLPDGLEQRQGAHGPVYAGTLPGVQEEVELRAALVSRPLELSTWDMVRREPRPTRRLVRAGSVYFFQKRSGAPFSREEVRRLWLAPWGQAPEEALGLVLPGLWRPEEKE